jgi:hypothetical protein
MDLAAVRFINLAANLTELSVSGVSTNCYRCLSLPLVSLNAARRASGFLALDTTFTTDFEVFDMGPGELGALLPRLDLAADDLRQRHDEAALRTLIGLHHETHDEDGRPRLGAGGLLLTRFSYHFGEHGIYNVIIRDPATHNSTDAAPVVVAQVAVAIEPDDANVPIYVAMGIIGAVAIVYLVGTYVYRVGTKAWAERQQNGDDGLDSMYGGQVPIFFRPLTP